MQRGKSKLSSEPNRNMAAIVLHLSPKPPSAFSSQPDPEDHSGNPYFWLFSQSKEKTKLQKRSHPTKMEMAATPLPCPKQSALFHTNNSPFCWASGDFVEYCSRLFVMDASFELFIGLPVAWFGSVEPKFEPVKLVLAAVSSGILLVTIAVLRMCLGWAYVGNRLLSATVEYEETGWDDGQIWVKTSEVLARDRLLGSFLVKPVLSRLKYTLVSLAVSLLVCVLPLDNIEGSQEGSYTTSKEAVDRTIPGVYDDDSARSFEPDAFCGEPGLPYFTP